MEPKQKQHPFVDITGDGSKVQSESVHSSQIRKGVRILSSQSQSPNLFDIPTRYFSLFPFTHTTNVTVFNIFIQTICA